MNTNASIAFAGVAGEGTRPASLCARNGRNDRRDAAWRFKVIAIGVAAVDAQIDPGASPGYPLAPDLR